MDIRSTPKEMCEAFNAHDLDRIMAFFSDDCVLEMPRGSKPWGSRFEGKRDVREALATRFEGLPDVHYGKDEHFVKTLPTQASQNGPSRVPNSKGTRREVQGCELIFVQKQADDPQRFILEDRGLRGPDLAPKGLAGAVRRLLLSGTFETWRPALTMSVSRGRSEVVGRRPKCRD